MEPKGLADWGAFYTLTGTSAAALVGLMFVVITIVTSSEVRQATTRTGVGTFSTPTVVHFAVAMIISALLAAPWPSLVFPAMLLVFIGLLGISYLCTLISRQRSLDTYSPDIEDWVWFTILPLVAYALICGGGVFLAVGRSAGPFAYAAGVLLLMVIGIHNAWDVVTFLIVRDDESTKQS
jgi:hypothetical protein